MQKINFKQNILIKFSGFLILATYLFALLMFIYSNREFKMFAFKAEGTIYLLTTIALFIIHIVAFLLKIKVRKIDLLDLILLVAVAIPFLIAIACYIFIIFSGGLMGP